MTSVSTVRFPLQTTKRDTIFRFYFLLLKRFVLRFSSISNFIRHFFLFLFFHANFRFRRKRPFFKWHGPATKEKNKSKRKTLGDCHLNAKFEPMKDDKSLFISNVDALELFLRQFFLTFKSFRIEF